jgi:uncharacterized protein (TIGR00369 family)
MDDVVLDSQKARGELLGYTLRSASGGQVEVQWNPGPALANPADQVHGGMLCAVADDVCGMALMSAMGGEPRAIPTVSLHTEFLRPVPIGGEYTCRGSVLKLGRRMAFVDMTVHDGDERLLARCSGTFAVG